MYGPFRIHPSLPRTYCGEWAESNCQFSRSGARSRAATRSPVAGTVLPIDETELRNNSSVRVGIWRVHMWYTQHRKSTPIPHNHIDASEGMGWFLKLRVFLPVLIFEFTSARSRASGLVLTFSLHSTNFDAYSSVPGVYSDTQ